MSDPTSYSASCHCNTIRFSLTLPEPLSPAGSGEINSCNCSICTKLGYLLVYPKSSDVRFEEGCGLGSGKLGSYLFGKKEKPHRFCKGCGTSVLIDFGNAEREVEREFLAVNARLLDGVDLENAHYTSFDGRTKLAESEEQKRACASAPRVDTVS